MDERERVRVGQVFLISGVVMVVFAAVFGFGVIQVEQPVRGILATVLGVAGVMQAVIGFRLANQS